jgi:hypothetical protein
VPLCLAVIHADLRAMLLLLDYGAKVIAFN